VREKEGARQGSIKQTRKKARRGERGQGERRCKHFGQKGRSEPEHCFTVKTKSPTSDKR